MRRGNFGLIALRLIFSGFLGIGRFVTVFCVISLAACAVQAEDAASPEKSPIGRQIESFQLHDYRGREHKLADYDDSELIVVIFLGTDCPLVRQYVPRINELARKYAERGVTILGINSNRQDTVTEVAAYARRWQLEIPILKDPGNVVADQFGAVRTPEAFVLDQQRVIRYGGRIDDQFGVGIQRPRATRDDLAIALDELLEEKPVSRPVTDCPGCFIGRVHRGEPRGEVTYSNQIARIVQRHCVNCHREGDIAPFELTDYDEVAGWAETMLEVVDTGRMPPWFADPRYGKFSNDAGLSDDEKELLTTWVENGCPEGDPKQLPEPVQYTQGWQIQEPDLIVHMRNRPFRVRAEGEVAYQHFTVDPGFKEDKWVQAAEARPGNPEVVHHILVFVQPPGANRMALLLGDGLLTIYTPGTAPWTYPSGSAIRIPAGSKLSFQVHYTPNGRVQEDRSMVGFVFADPATVQRKAVNGMTLSFAFRIPPEADNHEVTSQMMFREDTYLYSLFPHMHLRGKSFRYELEYTDGTREVLLNVPRYDFNWQLRYVFEEPKLVPRGTRLRCIAHFDNSEENLANPNPKAWVRFGDQTWEEMMIGFFTSIPAKKIHVSDEQDSLDEEQISVPGQLGLDP
jgi:peroxiredoxin